MGHREKRRIAGVLAVAVSLAASVGGCGGASTTPTLTVSAAASVTKAFTRYAHQFAAAHVRYSFAGSDALATQIEQGARPDVFASANTKLPELLFSRGLVERPVVFAANRLVLAVPAGSTRVSSLGDAQKPGLTLAIGTASVPVGQYTTLVLARLAARERARILANVRDREPSVTGIVGKLIQGAADGAFLYTTDVRAAAGRLRAFALPPALQPVIAYGVAVLRGSAHSAQARAFVSGLLSGSGRRDLLAAGFLPPPAR